MFGRKWVPGERTMDKKSKAPVLCGADRIDEYEALFHGRRLGLLTNPSGILKDLTTTADKLRKDYQLCALYAPEHGIRGDRQDGIFIPSYRDEATGVQVYSVYGERRMPSQEDLDEIDMMVFDIQDVGSRYYTYIYSMTNAMIACRKKGIPFVVLDRPNLIGGIAPEGTIMEPTCTSFIGMYDFPQRYSLTIGELAWYVNERFQIGAELFVIPLKGWKRNMFWEDTGLTWINPSPNLPSPDAALLYNGTCMFEGTTLSEGRGTTRPFEQIGAPWLSARIFAEALEEQECPGVRFRPASFIPAFGKHAGRICHGVQVHVVDKYKVKPVEMGIRMILTAKKLGKENFVFTPPNHEKGEFTIDLMFGSSLLRKRDITIREACEAAEQGTKRFLPDWEKCCSLFSYPSE